MIKSEADLSFVQEHKLKGKTLRSTKHNLEQNGWTLMCGPCDNHTRKPNAGVGVLVRRNAGVVVTRGKVQTDAYRVAYDEGRATKFHVDATWCTEAMCYVIYGQAGSNKSNKTKTQEIMEAGIEEMAYDKHGVQFMLGDFNAEPNQLDISKELIEEHQWVDVGAKADWWGGEANQKTCQTRPQAKPTRIDGILASREAVPWISGFKVSENEMIPTHKVLELTLSGEAADEERTFAKKLTSMKGAFLTKLNLLTADETDKEKNAISRNYTEQLKKSIENERRAAKTKLEVLAEARDTDGYWKLWSKSVERGWLRFTEEEKGLR